jgi:hypothetical protein
MYIATLYNVLIFQTFAKNFVEIRTYDKVQTMN